MIGIFMCAHWYNTIYCLCASIACSFQSFGRLMVYLLVFLQLRKIIQIPDFPSKRNPHLRTKPLEQRRQELEDYIQVRSREHVQNCWVHTQDTESLGD